VVRASAKLNVVFEDKSVLRRGVLDEPTQTMPPVPHDTEPCLIAMYDDISKRAYVRSAWLAEHMDKPREPAES
jgi:hypothetical protein